MINCQLNSGVSLTKLSPPSHEPHPPVTARLAMCKWTLQPLVPHVLHDDVSHHFQCHPNPISRITWHVMTISSSSSCCCDSTVGLPPYRLLRFTLLLLNNNQQMQYLHTFAFPSFSASSSCCSQTHCHHLVAVCYYLCCFPLYPMQLPQSLPSPPLPPLPPQCMGCCSTELLGGEQAPILSQLRL